MVMVNCTYCGKEFKDNHSNRPGKKFCCREHFRIFKKENGSWNTGKTWKEMYDKETLAKLEKRIHTKGEDHFNYNRKRPDLRERNIKNKIVIPDKHYAYQRKAWKKYGRICNKCGKTKGQIDVHHKDGNHSNNDINNLEVLCASCHAKLHKSVYK